MKRTIIFFLAIFTATFIHASDLGKAISAGDLEKVKAIIIAQPKLINEKDNQGWTPLIQALSEEKSEIAKTLISSGADVNIGDNENTQPIHFAAMMGSVEIFEMIRSKGVAFEMKDDNGLTPLFFAIKGKQPEMSKYLIDKGANVHAVTNEQWSLLLYTVIFGQTETAKLLIAKKVNVDAKNSDGFTPLLSATSYGRTEMVKLFVENGAKISETNNHGESAIFYTRNPNTYDAAVFLLEKGASLKSKNSFGGTPLMSVAGRGSVNVAELFIQHGASVNDLDSAGNSALTLAAYSRNPDGMSKFLIMNGADVNPAPCVHGKSCTCNPRHTTPLHAACSMGELNMVKNLVANGAKINVYNSDGYTPLLLATREGNIEVVKYLVDNGAFLNQKDKNLGYTELLVAASLGKKELVSWFIEKGADPTITTKDGKTALDLAWYYGHKNIAYTLLADGANDARLKELISQPQPLKETLADREATVWFLGTSGWAIKTKNHFLIFDYFFDSMNPAPADSSLASGYIAPEELKGQKVTVFSSHRHLDHYSKNIFKWKESLPEINYVLCFNTPDATSEDYTFIPIHEEKTVSGIKITTLKSTDMDGGYLVEVDGLTILHPGDLANGEDKLMKAYTDEIDRIAAKGLKIDLAFSPITGCSLGTPEQVKSGVLYMVDKLKPNLFIPMHANSPTDRFKKFADEMSTSNPNQKVQVVVQKGDRFTYKNGLTQN